MKILVNMMLAALLAQAPQDAAGWFQEGVKLHAAKDYAGALAAYKKAQAAGFTPQAQVYYREARVYSLMKDADNAFAALTESIKNGFGQPGVLQGDAEFENVRNDPRFAKAMQAATGNSHPCKTLPEYRQFDFWKGEWDVQTPAGATFAKSSIQLIIEDCVIFENYEHPSLGYTGKSFSVYDASLKHWTQRWIDSTGRVTDYVGDLINGEMCLRTEYPTPAGKVMVKMTYSMITVDKVRQHLENSTDGGKTWATTYDGIYLRKK